MKLLVFLICIWSTLFLHGQEPDSNSALYGLREAERGFSKAAAAYGRKAAFAEYLAENSVIFTSEWINNGKEYWKKMKATPVILKWEPEFMDISAGRDFGISMGPWESQEYRPYTKALSSGYFLSVWQKQNDGQWKVILDAGSTAPPMQGFDHGFTFPAGADKDINSQIIAKENKSHDEIDQIENEILNSTGTDSSPDRFKPFLSADVILIFNGKLPLKGIGPALAQSALKSPVRFTNTGTETAGSGDMGFTYGLIKEAGHMDGHYVRIWKKYPEGWKITIELMNPGK
jgi:ketosteroid isomerase-like protein